MAGSAAMWLAVALAAACAAVVSAGGGVLDPATGFIEPGSGVPDFNPEAWNRAYQLSLKNVPRSGKYWPSLPAPGGAIDVPSTCREGGFETTPAAGAAVGTCAYTSNDDGTYNVWVKLPGLALKNGNCYCYALDYFKGDYCVPGTTNGGAGRAGYREKMTCKAVLDAVAADGGVPVSRARALSGQAPDSGHHYIVFMARPTSCVPGHCGEPDFHVMRKDSSGTWSWKLPGVPASDRDLAGNLISDPESAPLPGHYQVCGYFQVQPSKMTIGQLGSGTGPLADQVDLGALRDAPGVSLDISPVPYAAVSDAAVPERSRAIFAEDLAWERKRGTPEYQAWLEKQLADLEVGTGGSSGSGSSGSGGGGSNSSNSSSGGGSTSSSASTSTSTSTSSSGRRLKLSRRLSAV